MRNTIGCLVVGVALVAAVSVHANDSEQVRQGATLYKEHCAVCHGESGRGGAGYPHPIWGSGAQIRKFKHALGLFEYNKLLMPFNDPNLLTDEQKWTVTAYLLANHAVMDRSDTLDPAKAAALAIP